ncbi:MAG: glycosyltransferase family 2 protein [Nitrososphaerota archaeon]|nr:glycosyltransferase family 2 protein [Nitrososphaerota archaeon]
MNKIDVCVPTLKPLSEQFISNIESTIPINRILTSSVKGRGKARQDLINHVQTDWFVFVDSDVSIRSNWFNNVKKYVEDGIGAVEGLWRYPLDARADKLADSMSRLSKMLNRQPWHEYVHRAFTGDTLIKTELVKDIRIPDVHLYEDEFIRDHLVRKGFRWIRTKEVVCDHLRLYNMEEAYEAGRHGYHFGKLHPFDQTKRMGLAFPKALAALLMTKDLEVALFSLKRHYLVWKGVMHAYVQGWHYA